MAPHAHHLSAHYSQNMYELRGNWFDIYLFLKYAMFLHYAVQAVNFFSARMHFLMYVRTCFDTYARSSRRYHDVLLTGVGRCWKHGRSHGETFALNWFNLGVRGPILFHNNLNNSMPQIHHILGTLVASTIRKKLFYASANPFRISVVSSTCPTLIAFFFCVSFSSLNDSIHHSTMA